MRVLSLVATSIIAMLVGLSTSANASWKGSVFGDNTSKPRASVTAGNSNKSTARRSATSNRTASTRTRSSSRRASQSRNSSSRTARSAPRGGSLRGLASYYWQPQRVASGGWFNPNALTAAHKTLPFGTRVRVTNLNNGRSVVVSINDRGPYIAGRIIDLSKRAAAVVGMQSSGVVPVSVVIL